MLEQLKKIVYEANLELVKNKLVIYTWGNVSMRDKETGYIVIKPSGVTYETMKWDDMVVVDLEGNIIEGDLKPSSDTKTHLEIYKAHDEINGIVHTHSTYAVSFAQAGLDIMPLGTTHADYFYGSIPCTRALSKEELEEDYEKNTGVVINETIKNRNIDVKAVPGILVKNHGVFAYGKDAFEAVYHATVLEEIAKMALLTHILNKEAEPIPQYLLDKHYLRKHGKNAYYGQNKEKK